MRDRTQTRLVAVLVCLLPACSAETEPFRGTAPVAKPPQQHSAAGAFAPPASRPAETVPVEPAPDDGTCGADRYDAEAKRDLELVVLFDNSASMAVPLLNELTTGTLAIPWDVAVSELTTFARDPGSAGLSVSLKYFGADCNPDFYASPEVPMGALPAHADAIAGSLLATLPLSETATLPALQGALRYARERSQSNADARVILLLVTDGASDPEDCPGNETAAVAAVAAEGWTTAPSIPTYVLVTAPGLEMDLIAKAGGTERARLADLAAPGQLLRIMNDVRNSERAALPCDYGLPSEYAKYNDPDLVNFTHDGTIVGRVERADACDAERGGWYYDSLPNPTQIHACKQTCQRLRAGGSVQVQLGCPVVELGPQ